jgi:hypothetical protein
MHVDLDAFFVAVEQVLHQERGENQFLLEVSPIYGELWPLLRMMPVVGMVLPRFPSPTDSKFRLTSR